MDIITLFMLPLSAIVFAQVDFVNQFSGVFSKGGLVVDVLMSTAFAFFFFGMKKLRPSSSKRIIFRKESITLDGFAHGAQTYNVNQFNGYRAANMKGLPVQDATAKFIELVNTVTKESVTIPMFSTNRWPEVFTWVASHYPSL